MAESPFFEGRGDRPEVYGCCQGELVRSAPLDSLRGSVSWASSSECQWCSLGDLVVGTDGWCSPVADMGDERPGHSHADCYSGCGVCAGQRWWGALRERSGFAGHGGPGRARCQGYGARVGRSGRLAASPRGYGMMKEILRPSRAFRHPGRSAAVGRWDHLFGRGDASRRRCRRCTTSYRSVLLFRLRQTRVDLWRAVAVPGRSRSFADVRGTRRQARVVSVSAESGSSFVARAPTGTPTCLFHRPGTRPHRVRQRFPVCARAPPVRCAPRSSPFGVPR